MKVRRMGNKKKVRLLRTRAYWVCLLTGLFVIAVASWPGARTSFAQSPGSQAEAAPTAVNAAGGANAQAAMPDPTAKREINDASIDARKKQIAADSANLLRLANGLKAAVDMTSQDTLSITVIRQADEVLKLAHKMRTK